MRILTLDIETSPNLAHVWGLWNQNVGLPQLLESGQVICFAAKWLDEKEVMYFDNSSPDFMVTSAWALLDEADVVVHYNGIKFDIPWLNTEFVKRGMTMPSPYHQIDLLRVVKKHFRFPSNKLDYVAGQLLGSHKVKHSGHTLWIRFMAGEAKAMAEMAKYNIADVKLTERLYKKLDPWIAHPTKHLYDGTEGCPSCGAKLQKRGFSYTKVSKFQRFVCAKGHWSKSGKRLDGVDVRGV